MTARQTVHDDEDRSRINAHAAYRRRCHAVPLVTLRRCDDRDARRNVPHQQFETIAAEGAHFALFPKSPLPTHRPRAPP